MKLERIRKWQILTDENYVDKAEEAIKNLKRNERDKRNPDAFSSDHKQDSQSLELNK